MKSLWTVKQNIVFLCFNWPKHNGVWPPKKTRRRCRWHGLCRPRSFASVRCLTHGHGWKRLMAGSVAADFMFLHNTMLNDTENVSLISFVPFVSFTDCASPALTAKAKKQCFLRVRCGVQSVSSTRSGQTFLGKAVKQRFFKRSEKLWKVLAGKTLEVLPGLHDEFATQMSWG